MSTYREAITNAFVALAALAALALAAVEGWGYGSKLFFAAVVIWQLVRTLGDLREADTARYGTFDLLVVCDHTPQGVRMTGLARHELWLQLVKLDPAHHLVWVNGMPLDQSAYGKGRGQ